jgi:hypothetical protein
MTIHVYANAPNDSDREKRAQEEQFFCDNLQLMLDRGQDILANSEYFFCPLSFAWCAFLWIGGGGPLCLGHLLLGWNEGILIEPCPDCNSRVFVTSFSGSPLSGSNSWSGFCIGCRSRRAGRGAVNKPFSKRMDFALTARKQFPQEVSHWEDYDGFIFSWGGNGLQPASKKRLVIEKVVEPVSLDVLVEELNTGCTRKGDPPQPKPTDTAYELELRGRNGSRLTGPIVYVGFLQEELQWRSAGTVLRIKRQSK